MKRLISREINNNKGFSLIELLVGITILGIVSVPLLRAFATSAQTNAKAKVQMKATTAAENVMEDFRNLTVDDLQAKVDEYIDTDNVNDATVTASGVITYTIRDNAEMRADLPDGYYAEVTLDPNMYPNTNSLNLADFETVSIKDNAIFTMDDEYDKRAYEEFVTRSATCTHPKDFEYFKDNLIRRITIDVNKTGTDTDDEGNDVDLCRVKIKIEYQLQNYSTILEDGKDRYITTEAVLFDNATSKKPLQGVYLFYYPRYQAATSGKDIIIVNNGDNFPIYSYVTAMDTATDAEKKAIYSPRILITENQGDVNAKAYTTLRTNLLKTSASTELRTPYSKGDVAANYGIKADLQYKGSVVNNQSGDTAAKTLSCGDINGKALFAEDTPVRIYKMRILIKDNDGKEVVELDGTKLKQY